MTGIGHLADTGIFRCILGVNQGFQRPAKPSLDVMEFCRLEGEKINIVNFWRARVVAQQVRDWLYVNDHCNALRHVLKAGRVGDTYNVGGWNEKTNLEIVRTICRLLDELRPRADGRSYAQQITHVADRPGHDRRYAIDARKLERELGWKPAETFETGIRKTVRWYLDHPRWVQRVQSGAYRQWVERQYEHEACAA